MSSIQLTDRPLWIKKLEIALAYIRSRRAQQDKIYEDNWRASTNFWRRLVFLKPLPESAKPADEGFRYPSWYGAFDEEKIEKVLQALRTEGTGVCDVSLETLNRVIQYVAAAERVNDAD